MRSKSLILPGCLVLSEESFLARLEFARATTQSIHVDVVDNDFVKGHTLPIEEWPELDLGYSEAHLMVRSPQSCFSALKAKKVTRAIVHVESEFDIESLERDARRLDILLGFAVNPDTDLATSKPLLRVSNYIQIMGVTPGKTGQPQLPQTVSAVSYFRAFDHHSIISVDGGVNASNVAKLKSAGANYFIASSGIYDNHDWQESYRELLEAVK
ncbi:hypothetical protein A3A71_02865 [Candidatus Berkelbacteria bacterium RIFCSPLOWO2_01_FULL_50_28]|uniref:Ribulose phosphate epimerase n=1 Tax=Candidatus Berkelbacteria bacterium RIFCSPLOWO2_01_FULL_50_28 TaxID=1797471 RepID=A0A1F5EC68_9BACT|nr:MAG: hypothetical protein A2807_02400 [Candidatus Berkelbacteria bacterium RIFCSPHIGHO2_01_FULL_50_36]OGD62654.1 MAG: hypothetical protein A3F39_00415 [Candidatus Berkelbacteria bacterium RIFCSPHIGHO2_12_FULL_50_11]OGD64963.1 MAG: hypothetical protein A3A71_02865 [Candidatus Berkelbacteria bacterium RIFCSPLOWO2_01_FULL_50_28]